MPTPYSNVIPEVLLYNVLKGILVYIRTDIAEKATLEETILYSILQDVGLDKHNYLSEAAALFSRPEELPRSVGIRLFFDAKRAEEPTIHVTLASDESGPTNSIGMNQDEDVWDNVAGDQFSEIYGRSFNTSLSIICTSSNHHEVLIMYYIIRNSLIAVFDTFELSGFQNIQITGRDLQIREDLVPNHIFSRAVMLRGFYETKVRNFFNTSKLSSILFENRKPFDSQG